MSGARQVRTCLRCGAVIAHGGGLGGWAAYRRHLERCEAATPEERLVFSRTGRWPRKAKDAPPRTNPKALGWRRAGPCVFKFNPTGRRARPNPWDRFQGGAEFANVLVGFNVGDRPKWKLADLKRFWLAARRALRLDPAATFYFQEGVYRHATGDKKLVTEKGATIYVLNLADAASAKFRDGVLRVAERLAKLMRQETIVAEFGRAGIVEETAIVSPPRRA